MADPVNENEVGRSGPVQHWFLGATAANPGTAGNDYFDGGGGQINHYAGGGGDDQYVVHDGADTITESAGAGYDGVSSFVDYTLPEFVNNLTLLPSGAIRATGNAEANILVGNDNANVIDGGAGNDELTGGGGSDRFVVAAGRGSDTITDFQTGAGGDVVELDNYGFGSFDEIHARMTALPHGGTQINLPNGETLAFLGPNPDQFTAANFSFSGGVPQPTPTPAPTPTGQDHITVLASADSWNGAPQFTIDVDGVQVGGPTAVTLPHGSGFASFDFAGDFGAGPHDVAIHFINDAWGGTPSTDRNLYIDAITFNGTRFEGEAAHNTADQGHPELDPNAAEMLTNGTLTFTGVTGGSGTAHGFSLFGTGGDDQLTGGPGNDVILGNDGNDVIEGRGGADVLDGGNGLDIALYSSSPAGVTVDLGAGTGHGGDAAGDTLTNFEGVRGSAFDDLLIGGAGNDELEGGLGNDTLKGGAGDDVLLSGQRGSGETVLSGSHFTGGELFPINGDGFDVLDGGTGNDSLIGGDHTTFLFHRGDGSDTILNYPLSSDASVVLDGYGISSKSELLAHGTFGFSNATFDLGGGDALSFVFGPGGVPVTPETFDGVNFVFTNSTSPGSAEGPTPTPSEARAFLQPDGTGTAHGTAAAEDIFATADNQTLIGGGGDDVFHIGTHAGLTIQETNPGTSTVSTFLTHYTLNDGIDNLRAEGDYAHTLTGNAGNNVVTGAGGNDTIDGGGGNDILHGGGGADTFVFRSVPLEAGHDDIADFSRAQGDKIALDYSLVHFGHVENFAQLQSSVTTETGADFIRLTFETPVGVPADVLTIHGITDLNAADWTFLSH